MLCGNADLIHSGKTGIIGLRLFECQDEQEIKTRSLLHSVPRGHQSLALVQQHID